MTNTSPEEALRGAFSKKTRAALGVLKGRSITPADLDMVADSLADNLATYVSDVLRSATQAATTRAATQAATRLAAAAPAPVVVPPIPAGHFASGDDLAIDNFMSDQLGMPRKFDHETGQRIQTVRVIH